MALMLNKPPLSLLFFNKEEFYQYKEGLCLCKQGKGNRRFQFTSNKRFDQINTLLCHDRARMLIKGCLLTGKKVYCVVNNEINRPHKITIFSHYTGFVFNQTFKELQIFILHSHQAICECNFYIDKRMAEHFHNNFEIKCVRLMVSIEIPTHEKLYRLPSAFYQSSIVRIGLQGPSITTATPTGKIANFCLLLKLIANIFP